MFCFARQSSGVRWMFRRTINGEAQSKLKTLSELPGPDAGLNKLAFATKYADKIRRLLLSQFDDKPVGSVVLNSQIRGVEKYGDIFRTDFLGLRPVVNVKVADPADVETLFRSESTLPLRAESPVQKYYRERKKKLPGMLFSNGEYWYRLRHVTNKKLLRPKEVPAYAPALNGVTTDFLTRLREVRGSSGQPNEIPDLQNELFKWSFESVAQVLFDQRLGSLEHEVNSEAQGFITAVWQFLDSTAHIEVFPLWFYKVFPTSMYRQFTRSMDQLYHYIELFISRKLQELEQQGKLKAGEENTEERVEFLHFLLASNMSNDDLVATTVDLLFAGVDTTATTMQWCLYLLGRNPQKQEKLYQEVHSVLNGDILSYEHLSDLPYLKACIKETLRLYPIAFHQRVLPGDTELSGYHIPAGTPIMILHYVMCQNPKFFDNPTEFEPERWLRSSEHVSRRIKPFTYLPFGFGKRMCVGRRIADLEIYLLLARIIQNFVVHYSGEEEEVKRSLHGVVIIPARPIEIQLVDRVHQERAVLRH